MKLLVPFFSVSPSQLDNMFCGEPYNLQEQGMSVSQTAMLRDILVHIGVESYSDNSPRDLAALLRAAHLLVSAMEGKGGSSA